MTKLRLLKTEVMRSVYGGQLLITVLMIVGISLCSSWNELFYKPFHGYIQDVNNVFCQSLMGNFRFLLPMAASIPFLHNFCQEWCNGYWKPLQLRSGTNQYLKTKAAGCLLLSFFSMFLGLLLFLLILLIYGRIFSWSLMLDIGSLDTPMPNHPYLYWFLRISVFSFASDFWAMTAFFVAVCQLDFFMAMTIPITFRLTLQIILSRITSGAFSFYTLESGLKFVNYPYIFGWLYAVLVTALLLVIMEKLTSRLLQKRIENEYFK